LYELLLLCNLYNRHFYRNTKFSLPVVCYSANLEDVCRAGNWIEKAAEQVRGFAEALECREYVRIRVQNGKEHLVEVGILRFEPVHLDIFMFGDIDSGETVRCRRFGMHRVVARIETIFDELFIPQTLRKIADEPYADAGENLFENAHLFVSLLIGVCHDAFCVGNFFDKLVEGEHGILKGSLNSSGIWSGVPSRWEIASSDLVISTSASSLLMGSG
jgi:hypothetical protein